jgi:demethylmenaquinone methyltransferase/2-methoxy-6-polyprenyl-1,4-benzoquinol methylase
MDQYWRRTAVRLASLQRDDQVVDVACGTGDLAIKFARGLGRCDSATARFGRVLGIDFTYAMLPIARKKWLSEGSSAAQDGRRGIQWINGDAMCLPLADASANVVSIAFGIRNVTDPAIAIREFHRVLKPGGRVIILEFSLPTNPVLRGLYNFYFRKVLPRTATLISGDRTGAYRYLPESVNTFIGREQMMGMMQDAGFEDVQQFPLTFGVCVCYRGYRR